MPESPMDDMLPAPIEVPPMLGLPEGLTDAIEDAAVPRYSSNEQLFHYVGLVDQKVTALNAKVDWMCQTLNWMGGIFQGLQAVSSMLPGKAGKIAQQVMKGDKTDG